MTYKSLLFSFVFVLVFVDFLVAQEKPQVTIGGALRFNYHYDSWRDDLKNQGGELVYDMFRLNATAEYKKISMNAEYRFYN